ncbi:hypothetical protein BaRGS_00028783, partial [Batillaria attramentaria]
LKETVESRRARASASSESLRVFFKGEVTTCARHPTERMTAYCETLKTGICQLCLTNDDHAGCAQQLHIEPESARLKASERIEVYKTQLQTVREEAESVSQTFDRKPRKLQFHKEELELDVAEYFSDLKSKLLKLVLAKEKEVMDSLAEVTQAEAGKARDSKKECEDIQHSIDNTLRLFQTLINSGPINALFVLDNVDEQVKKYTNVTKKLQQEASTLDVRFEPPEQRVEDVVGELAMGKIVAGSEQVVSPREEAGRSRSDRRGDNQAVSAPLEEGVAKMWLDDVSGDQMVDTQTEDPADTCIESKLGLAQHPPTETHNLSPHLPAAATTGDPLHHENIYSGGALSAPSAPPIADYEPPPGYDEYLPPRNEAALPDVSQSKFKAGLGVSSAFADAYSRSVRKDLNCQPIMVFSGNLPAESRRGGLCGAADMGVTNRAAFVDRHGHSLKIIDLHQAQIVGYLHLGDVEPWDITLMTNARELVVTAPGMRCILFVPTQNKRLEIARHMYTSHPYACIAYLEGDQFVGGVCAPHGPPAVFVFNTRNQVLRQILPGHFRYPRAIFTDKAGSLIVVSDWTSNVVVLVTRQGALVSEYREAPNPKGVAFSGESGLLYVLDSKWSRLHVLDTQGHCVGTGKVRINP